VTYNNRNCSRAQTSREPVLSSKREAVEVDILLEVIKFALIPLVILAMPILFVLVLDIAAHLKELFGR
jgi:hypothetical protein